MVPSKDKIYRELYYYHDGRMVIETPMFDKMTAKVSKDSLAVTALGKKLQGDYLSANFSIDATMSDDS